MHSLFHGLFASQISGHLWAPAGAYDALGSVTVPSGGLSSITFSAIPQTYTHLQIRGLVNLNGDMNIRFNSDTGNNYSYHYLYATGSGSVSAGNSASNAYDYLGYGGFGGSTSFTGYVCDILDYTSMNKNKTIKTLSGTDNNGSGGIMIASSEWLNNTTAINSITLFSKDTATFGQYSNISLYGIR